MSAAEDHRIEDSRAGKQPLLEHLAELRSRLLKALLAPVLLLVATLPFSRQLYALAAAPLQTVLPQGAQMIATEVPSPLMAPLRLSLFAAIVLSMPWVLLQLWLFVAPGLYRSERRIAYLLLPAAIGLFYLGILFCWKAVFPLLFAFFVGFAPEGVTLMTDISSYLDFVLSFALVFGLAFEVPVVTIVLVATGVASLEGLSRARPYLILGTLVLAMLLTPPDVISQLLLAAPVWLLFESGLLLSRLLGLGRKKA